MALEPNHAYLLDLVEELRERASPPLLDYGCGSGAVVRALLERGFDAHGVEAFYEGGSTRDAVEASGLLGTRIRELDHDRIPYADAAFDMVVSNQVFEHIESLARPVEEIGRVLRPGGSFVLLFPSLEVWREGHIGIPFAHRFAKGDNRARYVYTLAMRRLGFGYFKAGMPPAQWAHDKLAWLDAWTFYRPLAEIRTLLEPEFEGSDYGAHYLAWRLGHHPVLKSLAPLTRLAVLRPLCAAATFRLAGVVWVLRRR